MRRIRPKLLCRGLVCWCRTNYLRLRFGPITGPEGFVLDRPNELCSEVVQAFKIVDLYLLHYKSYKSSRLLGRGGEDPAGTPLSQMPRLCQPSNAVHFKYFEYRSNNNHVTSGIRVEIESMLLGCSCSAIRVHIQLDRGRMLQSCVSHTVRCCISGHGFQLSFLTTLSCMTIHFQL